MYIAQSLKEKNIAEYLIYMWQVEDLIRANELNMDLIDKHILSHYTTDADKQVAMRQWYEELIEMMRSEQVVERGHLQINKNVILTLTELHNALLASSVFPFYSAAYYKALPFIVELRNKSQNKEEPELETCFEALYGVMLLRLQKKTLSDETTKAIEAIAALLSLLANYYDKDRKGELNLEPPIN